MSHSVHVKIPEDLYSVLLQRALAAGRSVEDLVLEWVAQRARPVEPEVSPAELQARRRILEKYVGICKSEDPNAADNERIDADLAKEYGRGLDGVLQNHKLVC
ncbi:MAG: hypothetical protein ABSE73_07035 [Planctomycetota bacterium]